VASGCVQQNGRQPELANQRDTRREIRGYEAVRAAARDYKNFSSDLRGDRDVRSYRQLPLEVDPPRHTQLREAIQPMFMDASLEPHRLAFEEIARSLIGGITTRGHGEVVSDVALRYVVGCLSLILNRPQDVDEWLSWGADVSATFENSWEERAVVARSGDPLDSYLSRVLNEARAKAGDELASMDIWDKLVRLEVAGEPLSADEQIGIGNLLLAGGRDTTVKVLCGFVWHLISNPADRTYLTENPDAMNDAIAEMVRYLSPLRRVERVLPEDKTPKDRDRDPDKYVLVSFVSANFDSSFWGNPEDLDIRRPRRAHVGFGFGRHACLGMKVAQHEIRAFLRVLLAEWPNWEFDRPPNIIWGTERDGDGEVTVLDEFLELHVRS
jgi:cytochrome P450